MKRQLVRFTEDWKQAIDRKELMTILSADMSKAFDSLCHNLVIKKLKAYEFTSQSLDLIRSFLNDRNSRVKLGTIRSEWSKMSRGCPQGSSFGPLLWNLFQNDMKSPLKIPVKFFKTLKLDNCCNSIKFHSYALLFWSTFSIYGTQKLLLLYLFTFCENYLLLS